MNWRTFLFSLFFVGAFFAPLAHVNASVTWTEQDAASGRNWVSITSSSDGTKIAAVEQNGDIYTSFDSGATWSDAASAGTRNWYSITSSSDGTKLAAVAINGDIYTSANSGGTWTDQTAAGTRNWFGIASSADGTKLVAVVYGGDIYTSTDSGITWTDQTAAGSRDWQSVASSVDGTKLAAVVQNGDIYTSTDSGATWTDQTAAGTRNWYSITSSSDGTKLAAVVGGSGDIYTSTDSGATWTDQTAAGTRNWYSITSLSDGTKLAAVSYGGSVAGDIYTSTDSGATWTDQTAAGANRWQSVTSSADGTKFAAVVLGGGIYTSVDSGGTWTQQALAGAHDWQSITSSADGTKLAAGASTDFQGDIYTATLATPPPVVTNSTATISWSSDTAVVSQVAFGLTSLYTASSTPDAPSTYHSVVLTNLISCSVYHYQAISGMATFIDTTFSTTGCIGGGNIASSSTAVITASGGGSTALSGKVTLTVPASYTATTTAATFSAVELPAASFFAAVSKPSGLSSVGASVYTLTAFITPTTKLTTFEQPLTVSLTYDPSDLAGIDPTTLRIYRYDSLTWTALTNCTTTTSAHTVSCDTSNFSSFALFGTPAVQTPAPQQSSGGGGGGGMSYGSSAIFLGYKAPVQMIIYPNGATTTASTTSVLPVAVTPRLLIKSSLYRGLKNKDVIVLQGMLISLGLLPADSSTGYFGVMTQAAVGTFQIVHKLVASKKSDAWGYVGPETRKALNVVGR